MNDTANEPPRRLLRGYVPVVLTATVGLAVTGLVFAAVDEIGRVQREGEFTRFAEEQVQAVRRSIDLQINELEGTLAFFYASHFVERGEFQQFVTPILKRRPAIRAVEWVYRLSGNGRTSFEQDMRDLGATDFRVREIVTDNKVAPAGHRREYYVVQYLEPYRTNERALGLDLASERARRRALTTAGKTGETAATEPLVLVQEEHARPSVLVFLPKYHPPPPAAIPAAGASADADVTDTDEERAANLVGFVLGILDIDRVVQDAVSRSSATAIAVTIRDEGRPLGHHDPTPPSADARGRRQVEASDALTLTREIEVGGRTWSVQCMSTPEFARARSSPLPIVAAGTGLVFTLLLTGYVFVLVRRGQIERALVEEERRHQQDAEQAADALRDSEHRYRTLIEHAPEAVGIMDMETGCFADANKALLELFKLDRESVLSTGPVDMSPTTQPDGRDSIEAAAELIERTLSGKTPIFGWVFRDAEGREFPSEVRLVQLPSADRVLIRGSVVDISERVRSEQRQQLMMRELDHRVKNNLAAVLALAEQTATISSSLEQFLESFTGRVRAMARTHRALADQRWEGVQLPEVVRLTLSPYLRGDARRIHTRGEPLLLSPESSSAIGMAMHELATNAAKYGALSTPEGSIDLQWARSNGTLMIDWVESGGPPVTKPDKVGFGAEFLRGVVEYELGGTVQIQFEPAGLECHITLPLSSEVVSLDASLAREPEQDG